MLMMRARVQGHRWVDHPAAAVMEARVPGQWVDRLAAMVMEAREQGRCWIDHPAAAVMEARVQGRHWVDRPSLSVQPKSVESSVDGGAQVQQLYNMECVTEFAGSPILNISFVYSGSPQRLSLKLPVMLNKFMEAAEMNAEAFFQRWKALSQPEQECQRIFKAQFPQDTEQSKQKLLGFGVSILDGIDPNPDNFVSSGILHTRGLQIGCLVRLEPNRQAEMYRLTVRSTKNSVSETVCDLLETQF
ncbi:hypothetical protein ACOMHN_007711 [Nucella lapillus]